VVASENVHVRTLCGNERSDYPLVAHDATTHPAHRTSPTGQIWRVSQRHSGATSDQIGVVGNIGDVAPVDVR
jgi:hypothetical protein